MNSPDEKKTTVSVEIDPDVYSKLKQASQVISLASGLSVPAARLIGPLVNAKLSQETPAQMATSFMKTIMGVLRGIPPEKEEDED